MQLKKTMATETENKETQRQIDNTRTYSRRRRSPGPKRRTDFSPFCSSSSLHSNSVSEEGSRMGWSHGEEGSSDIIIVTSSDEKDVQSDSAELPLNRCFKLRDQSSGFIQNASYVPHNNVESASEDDLNDQCVNGDSPKSAESTPEKFHILLSNGDHVTPESAVRNKKASQMPRPAKALHLKGHQSSYRQLFSNQNVAGASNKKVHCSSSNSSRTTGDALDKETAKKKRKSKSHIDEVSHPSGSSSADRRLKIMRRLGLTPPIGSPFQLAHS